MREFININDRLNTFLTPPENEITIVHRSQNSAHPEPDVFWQNLKQCMAALLIQNV
jgi:hypothetical protein